MVGGQLLAAKISKKLFLEHDGWKDKETKERPCLPVSGEFETRI